MSVKIIDRAFETTMTVGTGDISLEGAVDGYQSFSLAGNGARVLYQINDGDESGVVQNWEIGIGTFHSGSSNTLSRTTILSSSNSNAAVNFGGGTKNVIMAIPAQVLATRDENLNFVEAFGTGGGTANAHTVTLPITPLGYSDGMVLYYFATLANTGNMTINANSLGNISARMNGAQVPAGAVAIGSLVRAVYSVTSGYFEITSSSYTESNLAKAATALQPGQAFSAPFMHLQDQKPSGTAGGASTTSYSTRVLNTVLTNTISGASLSANQIILPAGTYYIDALAPAYAAGTNKAKLTNVTDGTDLLQGTTALANSGNGGFSYSHIFGYFTLSASKTIIIQHRADVAQPTNGFGAGAAYGDTNVYTNVNLWKVA